MKLHIENGVLIKCTLSARDRCLTIPEGVTAIAPGAFSELPAGRLKQLQLPKSLRDTEDGSFIGVEDVPTLILYTHEKRNSYLQMSEMLRPETIVILRDPRDEERYCFSWYQIDDVRLRKIVMDASIEMYWGSRSLSEGVDIEGLSAVEEMTILVGDDDWLHDQFFTCTDIRYSLKTLRFFNRRVHCEEISEVREFSPVHWMDLKRHPAVFVDEFSKDVYEWCRCDPSIHLYGLENLEEVILPEGMTKTSACKFDECPKLKKLVFPSSLRSFDGAFYDLDALKTVLISDNVLEALDYNFLSKEEQRTALCPFPIHGAMFSGCNALRKISFYHEDPVTGNRKATVSMDTDDWIQKMHGAYVRYCISPSFKKHSLPCGYYTSEGDKLHYWQLPPDHTFHWLQELMSAVRSEESSEPDQEEQLILLRALLEWIHLLRFSRK